MKNNSSNCKLAAQEDQVDRETQLHHLIQHLASLRELVSACKPLMLLRLELHWVLLLPIKHSPNACKLVKMMLNVLEQIGVLHQLQQAAVVQEELEELVDLAEAHSSCCPLRTLAHCIKQQQLLV